MSDPLVFTVSKADPTGKEPTAGAVLNITADLPIVRDTLPRAIWRAANIDRHVQDAQQVVAALAHLPQGTVDQVLVLLLEQRASLLRVAGSGWPAAPAAWLKAPPEFRAAVSAALDETADSEGVPDADKLAAALWESLRPRGKDVKFVPGSSYAPVLRGDGRGDAG